MPIRSPRRSFRATRGRATSVYNSASRNNRRSSRQSDYINPSRFVKAARPVTVEEAYVPQYSFGDFAIHDLLKSNLIVKGIATPTPIQDQTIPHGLDGKDIVGIANTGTGKTLAFALPVLHKLMESQANRALIMAPTRELAQQIEAECKAIARASGLRGALLIGGAPMKRQLDDLKLRPQIVIGTPGRIKDHLERGTLHLAKFNIVVLDEVDRMLDMGFINDMRTILQQLSPERQSFFYSATMDDRVRGLIDGFIDNPLTISVKTGETSDSVEQDVVRFRDKADKMDRLHDLLTSDPDMKVLVFDETQRSVERLSKELAERGFNVDSIHGAKTQGQRQRALRRFKENEITILVATDVAARGIDIADITHVINYTAPRAYEDYVHRIGRAGRAGRTGFAFTFVESHY